MKILLLNQAFYPDVASTAQHAADLASALAACGHEVTVLCSRRGYDDPRLRYERAENWRGVRIERLPCLGLGKRGKLRRMVETAFFAAACALRLLLRARFDTVIAMTSPPFVFALAAAYSRLRNTPLIFWVMDLNPDEATAAGWLREGSMVCKVLENALRFSLNSSEKIVVLDRFMRERLLTRGIPAGRIAVVPPWSHDGVVRYDPAGRAEFRTRHGLDGKFVVMYSGNHSPCHPLDVLIHAAERLRDNDQIAFCFAGGGNDYERLRRLAAARRLANVTFLPYQPLERLAASLSSADLHVVALGEAFVGVVHPCKIYNILRLGVPVLYIGPRVSHISDLLAAPGAKPWAYAAPNDSVEQVVGAILAASRAPLAAAAAESARRLAEWFSHDALVNRMIDIITAPDLAAAGAEPWTGERAA